MSNTDIYEDWQYPDGKITALLEWRKRAEAAEARATELQAEVERLNAICQESLEWFEIASNTPLAEAVAVSMVRRLRAAIERISNETSRCT